MAHTILQLTIFCLSKVAAKILQIKGLTQKETKNKELFDKDESDRGRRDISNKVLTEEGNFEIKSEPSLCQYNNEEAQNKQRELSVTTDHNIQNLEGYQSTGFNEEEYHDEHGNNIHKELYKSLTTSV